MSFDLVERVRKFSASVDLDFGVLLLDYLRVEKKIYLEYLVLRSLGLGVTIGEWKRESWDIFVSKYENLLVEKEDKGYYQNLWG